MPPTPTPAPPPTPTHPGPALLAGCICLLAVREVHTESLQLTFHASRGVNWRRRGAEPGARTAEIFVDLFGRKFLGCFFFLFFFFFVLFCFKWQTLLTEGPVRWCVCTDKRGPHCRDHVEEPAIISLVFLQSHDGPQRGPFTAFDCPRRSLNIHRLVFFVFSCRRQRCAAPPTTSLESYLESKG